MVSYRDLPAVHGLLEDPALAGLPRELCRDVAQQVLDELRQCIAAGSLSALPAVAERVAGRVRELLDGRLEPVLNATGVVLHTNLGRAPWADEAVDAAAKASGYCNLEMSLQTGQRGGRTEGVRRLVCALTGAEDAVVVNNGAAALLLALTALAKGREVLVSRGELVEIGGSFRVPDIIEAGGARLVEVGTTNRTRLADLVRARTEQTAVVLSVHPSNFRLVGFTEQVPLDERQAFAREHGLAHVEDVGSGSLSDEAGERGVREAVAAGVDAVVFSGDKLLGGPQAGFVVGPAATVRRLRKHPLYRALRLDKTLLAALEATLSLHLRGEPTPTARLLADDPTPRATRLCALLTDRGVAAELVAIDGATGGGARPEVALPSAGVAVAHPRPNALADALRRGRPSVLARVVDDALTLDARALPDDALSTVAAQVAAAVGKS